MSIQFSFDNPAFMIMATMVGFSVLITGRQIFWVFVTGLSFFMGLILSRQFYSAQSEWELLLISFLFAALGAVLAYTVQQVAAGIAGFATGWYLATLLMGFFNINLGLIGTALPYIAGTISAVLIMMYYDWGVIIASSLAGSAIIVSGMNLAGNVELVMLIMLALLGMAIQAIWFMQEN